MNPEALGTIHDFEVEKHAMIPTHSIIRMELSRNALQEERTFLKKLGSLKGMIEDRIRGKLETLEPKEANERRKEEVAKLKEGMDCGIKGQQH